LLGAQAAAVGSYRATDSASVCKVVRESQQDRRGGRRSHLRGRRPPRNAVCSAQVHRESDAARATSRAAQTNQIRGFLAEFGFIIPQGPKNLEPRVPDILADAENGLPDNLRQLRQQLLEHARYLREQAETLEAQIKCWHERNEASRRLAEVPGIGVLTASALVASIGDTRVFGNGRQLTAWLGLVPRQHSRGDKPHLLGVSKRGDTYLRTLLVQEPQAR
jgi:transposase